MTHRNMKRFENLNLKQQMTGQRPSFSMQVLALSLVSLMTIGSLQAQQAQKGKKGEALMETTHQTLTKEKHHFEPNKGQIADHEGNVLDELEYVYRAPGMKLGLTDNGFHYNLYTVEEKQQVSEATGKPAQKAKRKLKEEADQRNLTYHYHRRVEVNFKGANEDIEIIAAQKTDYYANYYLAHCPEGITNVHSYRKLTYKNLYDNIDLVLTPQQNEEGKPGLKYNIRVRPGGDLSDVKMAYKGMDGLSLKDGQLTVKTSEGKLQESIPASFWADSRESVDVDYRVKGNVVSFEAEAEQAKRQETLVVDPSLSWSTYLGGSSSEEAKGLITDRIGNVYLTGDAISDFPTTSGAYQESYGGGTENLDGDAFLSKFTGSGSLSWSTYLGGSKYDQAFGLDTDGNGNVYVTGYAQSDFPTTSGAYQESNGGDEEDAFLSKFTNSGSLSWSTYLGGDKFAKGKSVTTDGSGNVYVTGIAESGFTTTSGAYKTSYGGGRYDAFLSKFTSSGSLTWSTYIGGSNTEDARGITTDGSGNVYITGYAQAGFPTSSGAYQTSNAGSYDAYLSKFTSSGSLSWSTYLGGSKWDDANDVSTDGNGNVYVAGGASSGFPTTSGAYDTSGSAFLTKFTGSGNLSWSTYFSGVIIGITTDGSGNLYVTGGADTTFPTTSDAYQESYGGDGDGFLSKFTGSGNLTWSTYLGGSAEESGEDVTTDGSGNVYVTGGTDGPGFPTTSGVYQESLGGFDDAFLSKFDTSTNNNTAIKPKQGSSSSAFKTYPNPFRDNVSVNYKLPTAKAQVKLVIVDEQGRVIKRKDQGRQPAGQHTHRLKALGDAATGTYFIRLMVNGKQQSEQQVVKTE